MSGEFGDVWLTVVSANVGRKGGADGSKRALGKINEFAPHSLVAGQEIGEADRWDEMKMFRHILGGTRHVFGSNTKVPVAVPAHWEVLSYRRIFAAPGVPRVGPTRYITEVHASNRGIEAVVLNTHFHAGAWNHKKERKEWLRRKLWWLHWRTLCKRIAYWQKRGVTVIVTGDFNRSRRVPTIARGEVELEHGLDVLKVIPGRDVDVTVERTGHFGLPIEPAHDAIWASIHLVRKEDR